MADKAYIVTNEQQEREVLEKLYSQGKKWNHLDNYLIPRKQYYVSLPYVIYEYGDSDYLKFGRVPKIKYSTEIVFDGRKEEQMSEKYVVSQEFMNSLNQWRENLSSFSVSENFVGPTAIEELDDITDGWWNTTELSGEEQNNRLIAIIRWVNGEDVFEVENPKKWVVRSKEPDSTYCYAQLLSENNNTLFMAYSFANATRFDTKEEAQSWANAHQEVVEVEE